MYSAQATGPHASVGVNRACCGAEPARTGSRYAVCAWLCYHLPAPDRRIRSPARRRNLKAAIQESLFDLMEGKTVIAIAHRLSTIAQLDRLVVMDQGRIVETGTHDELVEAKGIYADLWSRQSGGFLPTQALPLLLHNITWTKETSFSDRCGKKAKTKMRSSTIRQPL